MTLTLYVKTEMGFDRVRVFRAKRQPLRWVAEQVFTDYPELRGQKCYVAKRVRNAFGQWADGADLIPLN